VTIIYSFLFCGLVCLFAQIILDNTVLTPGHITSLFVVIGSFLGTFGIYDKIIKFIGCVANTLIISFGNTLTNYAYNGYLKNGLIGIFQNMLCGVSVGIVSAIVFSFILTIFTKLKD
jgi:stage V sporulation protein AE